MNSNGVTPSERLAILRDYRRRNPNGDHRHTVAWVADKHGLTPDDVESLRRQAGTAPNGATLTRLYGCPVCSFRALHPLGHAVCMGHEELAEVEASQALQAVSQSERLEVA